MDPMPVSDELLSIAETVTAIEKANADLLDAQKRLEAAKKALRGQVEKYGVFNPLPVQKKTRNKDKESSYVVARKKVLQLPPGTEFRFRDYFDQDSTGACVHLKSAGYIEVIERGYYRRTDKPSKRGWDELAST